MYTQEHFLGKQQQFLANRRSVFVFCSSHIELTIRASITSISLYFYPASAKKQAEATCISASGAASLVWFSSLELLYSPRISSWQELIFAANVESMPDISTRLISTRPPRPTRSLSVSWTKLWKPSVPETFATQTPTALRELMPTQALAPARSGMWETVN